MSAATSVQATLPLEVASPCQILVMYEDAVAHDLAMEVCGGVMARFEADLAFAFSFWKVKDLNDPVSAHWATEAVARADIVLLSLPAHDLTPEISRWLDACVLVRTKAEGALAVIVTEALVRAWPSGHFCPGCSLSLIGCEWIFCRCCRRARTRASRYPRNGRRG